MDPDRRRSPHFPSIKRNSTLPSQLPLPPPTIQSQPLNRPPRGKTKVSSSIFQRSTAPSRRIRFRRQSRISSRTQSKRFLEPKTILRPTFNAWRPRKLRNLPRHPERPTSLPPLHKAPLPLINQNRIFHRDILLVAYRPLDQV